MSAIVETCVEEGKAIYIIYFTEQIFRYICLASPFFVIAVKRIVGSSNRRSRISARVVSRRRVVRDSRNRIVSYRRPRLVAMSESARRLPRVATWSRPRARHRTWTREPEHGARGRLKEAQRVQHWSEPD